MNVKDIRIVQIVRKKGIGNTISFSIDTDCQWITISDNGNGIPYN